MGATDEDEAAPFIDALPDVVEIRPALSSSSSRSDVIITHPHRMLLPPTESSRERRITHDPHRRGRRGGPETRIKELAKAAKCPCPGGCHERAASLWTKNTVSIRTIMHEALRHHLDLLEVTETVLRPGDLSSSHLKTGDTFTLNSRSCYPLSLRRQFCRALRLLTFLRYSGSTLISISQPKSLAPRV